MLNAKCLKHRNSKWDNSQKHQFPLKKTQKIDMSIFLIYQILTDLKIVQNAWASSTHPNSRYQCTYFSPSLVPKFSSVFLQEKYSIPILRNENSEYNWYRSIDFYYKCTWSLGFKKFKINTLFSVCQYKANSFTN